MPDMVVNDNLLARNQCFEILKVSASILQGSALRGYTSFAILKEDRINLKTFS